MAWIFGRKSAVPDARALVPAWLSVGESEGFARSYEAQFEEVFPEQFKDCNKRIE